MLQMFKIWIPAGNRNFVVNIGLLFIRSSASIGLRLAYFSRFWRLSIARFECEEITSIKTGQIWRGLFAVWPNVNTAISHLCLRAAVLYYAVISECRENGRCSLQSKSCPAVLRRQHWILLYSPHRFLPALNIIASSDSFSTQSQLLYFSVASVAFMSLFVWLCGVVVSALGMRTRRPRFESRVAPLFHRVATLGKLFTHIASPVSHLQETGVQKGVFGA